MAHPYRPHQDSQDRTRPGRPPTNPYTATHRYPQGQGPNPPPIRLGRPGQPPPPRPSGFPTRPQFSHHPSGAQGSYRPNRSDHSHHPRHDHPTSYGPHQFPLHPLDRFKTKCAPFRQPTEIGSFSYDEQRKFIMDDSQLKYYFPPDLRTPNNLSVNYEKYVTRNFVDEHIDALLDALMCIKDQEQQKQQEKEHTSTSQQPSMTKADIVCYRGMLTKIMCTPYDNNESWEMNATLFNGTIYIEEDITDEKLKNAAGSNARHKLMSYWGYRFETICNISKPVSELRRIKTNERTAENEFVEQIDLEDPELVGRLDGIVNTKLQYCTVVRTRIGQNSVIMGAEVDCISEPKRPSHNPLSDYIELKTSRAISSTKDKSSFERYKLLKFWAQSFLPGIPTIIVGFRDDKGDVLSVETFKTNEIPRLVRHNVGAWDTTVCINFLDRVLNFVRERIVKDDPTVTYIIRWNPQSQAIEVEYAGEGKAFLTERFLKRWGYPPSSPALSNS